MSQSNKIPWVQNTEFRRSIIKSGYATILIFLFFIVFIYFVYPKVILLWVVPPCGLMFICAFLNNFFRVPLKVGILQTELCLKYKNKEKEILWKDIHQIIRYGHPKYSPRLKILLKNGEKIKLWLVNKEIIDKIYNQFQSYKQSHKET